MIKALFPELAKPFSTQAVSRLMAFMIFALALVAGYYYTVYQAQLKKYAQLEDRYVRVRTVLGIEETQRLIDLSYESKTTDQQDAW